MTAEKKPSIPSVATIISIVTCTAAIITSYYNSNTATESKINEVKSEVIKLKYDQEIIVIQQKNGFQNIDNRQKVETESRINGNKEVNEKLEKLTNAIYRISPYNQKPIANQ